MVNPDTIPDGRFTNLYCPECQANPENIETHPERDGWRTLRCAYCLVSLNSTIDSEYVPTTRPPDQPFDDRLFATDE
ncbi:hypothetical protein [Natronorubrum texcoconense]|uniref:Uncharacterized protein n=1 Tax=Natronorubrum texcoconense TaxID=1095776 RepID=A0A1G9HA09_9EURY|nr:hypothetical protein [Natronorubrum texcoconense]SDL09614.1 hypothetical protein SAMN04515672_0160 [Natronorubrum texcoconense]